MNNNLNIGNRIAEYRREKGATQEHLADYVGVSVAAVSKWETNQSYPDITLLPSIADFFEVTIDSLLDYTIADNQKKYKQIRDSIQQPMLNGDYNTVLPVTLEALKKYPNDFELLEITASMLNYRAWKSATQEQDFKDSIRYYERALQCAETPEAKNRTFGIKKDIAQTYHFMGDTATAIEKLSEINETGVLNLTIADLKYQIGDKKEAKKLLQNELWNTVFHFWELAYNLACCYEDEGNLEMALETQKLQAHYLSAFISETPSIADTRLAFACIEAAKYCKKLGRIDEMWENLDKAAYHAVRIEERPSIKVSSIKFLEECNNTTAGGTSPESTCHFVLRDIRNDFKEFETDERHIKFCEKLSTAKKNKIESGLWAE